MGVNYYSNIKPSHTKRKKKVDVSTDQTESADTEQK